MNDVALRYPLFDHYMFVRGLHIRMAVASIHFGDRVHGTELDGDVALGSFTVSARAALRCDWWSEVGIVAAVWSETREPCGNWNADLPATAAKLLEGKGVLDGQRPAALRWLNADGAAAWGEPIEIDLGDLAHSAGSVMRPYRSPHGEEALSLVQEMLIDELASHPLGRRQQVTAQRADILLAPPYRGGASPREADVAGAARRFAQAGIDWSGWAEDLARPRPRPRTVPPQEALFEAVRQGSIDGCARAVSAGADPNQPASKKLAARAELALSPGLTCLNAAIGRRQAAIVEWLLEHGASANLQVPNHFSPWACAVHSGGRDICEILLRHGVDPRAEPFGTKLFGLAKGSRDLEVIRLLMELGAELPPEKPFPGIPSTRAMLADLARRRGNEALALEIESYRSNRS